MLPRRDVRTIALLTILATFVISGCSCDDDVVGDAPMNMDGRMCPTGEIVKMGRCTSNSECCPREGCNIATGICFARDACNPNEPCENPEQICTDSDGDGFFECVYERCEEDAECADLMCPPDKVAACISGGCQCGEPCQGGCPSGQGCCVPEDRCYDLPPECQGLTCPPGQFISVTSSGAWSTGECRLLGEACACEILPPLPFGDIGLYSAMAHDGTSAVMSAYNLDYGDLMFGVVEPDNRVSWEFIDGVSTTTVTITGDINGPRGGNSEPGPNVGIYTDIAVDGEGYVHIVYQDRDLGALKYARGGRGLPFRSHIVEGEGRGDTGLFASLALDAAGQPRIAYLSAREAGPSGSRHSVLKLAYTATTAPSSSMAWQVVTVRDLDLSPYTCVDRCDPGEACRSADQACVTPDPPPNACGISCAAQERCVAGVCTEIDELPPFRDLPYARGLWPSLAIAPDGDALILFHDRVDNNLQIVRIEGPDLRSGAQTLVALDGNGVNGSTDVAGLFPSLYLTPAGEIHISYMNQTRNTLIYRSLSETFQSQLVEIVEEGLATGGGPEGILIGADSSLVVDRTGIARIAYQNATRGELRYARRMGAGWNVITLAGDEMPYRGSFGFYADQVLDPNREGPRVSSYRYFLSAPNGPDNGIEVFDAP